MNIAGMTIDEVVAGILADTDRQRRNRRIREIMFITKGQNQLSPLSRCCDAGGGPFLDAVSEAMDGPKEGYSCVHGRG